LPSENFEVTVGVFAADVLYFDSRNVKFALSVIRDDKLTKPNFSRRSQRNYQGSQEFPLTSWID
jgi:hypothetical protein